MSRRIEKVNSLVKETIATTIASLGVSEVGVATITCVDVSPDFKQVKVYVEILGNTEIKQAIIDFLENNKSKIQHELAKLNLKFTPVLTLAVDQGSDNLARVEQLLDEIKNYGEN